MYGCNRIILVVLGALGLTCIVLDIVSTLSVEEIRDMQSIAVRRLLRCMFPDLTVLEGLRTECTSMVSFTY